MTKRYFRPEEVDALIPELMRIMDAVMRAHAQAAEGNRRLQGEQQRIVLAGGGLIDRERWRETTAQIERNGTEVERGLARIAALGGTPKDLTMGLVDFPGLLDNDEVNLCWRHGEPQVRFWHGLDEGYAARKPFRSEDKWS